MRSAWCALSRSLCADDASFALSLAISSSCRAAPGQDAARCSGPPSCAGGGARPGNLPGDTAGGAAAARRQRKGAFDAPFL